MEGTDICFAPILTMAEAPKHPHMAARKVFVERHGVTQPAPAPRFSRTPSAIREPEAAEIGELTSDVEGGKVTLRASSAKAAHATCSNPVNPAITQHAMVRARLDASRAPGTTSSIYAALSTFSTPRRI